VATTVEVSGKVPVNEKLGYGSGYFGFNLLWQSAALLLMYFYTEVFGISARAVSILFLVSRIWDAVNDPIMGYIADHTRTRWGKFRPYLLFGSFPLAIITFLVFLTPSFIGTGRLVYAYITYILFGMLYTMTALPFNSLISVMTQDTHERTSVTFVNTIFTFFAVAVVSVAAKPLINLFPTQELGYSVVMSGFGVICVATLIISFIAAKERVTPAVEHQKYRLKDVYRVLGTNRPLVALALTVMLSTTAVTMASATSLYYFKYYMGDENLWAKTNLMVFLPAVIGYLTVPPVSRRIGKRNTIILFGVFNFIGCILLFSAAQTDLARVIVARCVMGFAAGAAVVLAWSMLADTVEYAEWKTGIRAAGTAFSTFTFTQKLGTALGGSLGAAILAATGYVPNVEQTAPALLGIRCLVSLVPAAGGLMAIAALLFYNLDAKLFNRIVAELNQRRKNDETETN